VVTVLEDILKWSGERPGWQRDALRRLVLIGELSDEDIGALTEICKSAHGLAEPREGAPLTKDHVPDKTVGVAPVSLCSIFHHRGVNALAEGQTLKFSPSLTLVYGDNGAGKTGYIRILKSACRARGQEKILGNVVSGTAPLTPLASIKYRVGPEEDEREWSGNGADKFISRVSVFDTQCASVYLTEKTDVAFRPFGLDLFDKLVKACKAVRAKLESEQRELASNALSAVHAEVEEGTAVARLVANITSLTKPESVQALADLTAQDEARLTLLEKSLLDLQANDPKKLSRQLTIQAGRVRALVRHLKEVEVALSEEAVAAAFDTRAEGQRKGQESKELRQATFPAGLLEGTGSELWTTLWESARRFSQEKAYPGQTFPIVDSGANCVLCQQDLDPAARERLSQFEAFVASSAERELREVRDTFARLRKGFTELAINTEVIDETLEEIRIDHETVADAITSALVTHNNRRTILVQTLNGDKDLPDGFPAVVSITSEADALADEIEARVATLRTSSTEEVHKNVTAEAKELRARKVLGMRKQVVLDEIERKKRYAAYGLCIDETKTQTITHKSTEVTRVAVTQTLKRRFRDELVNLAFHHVEVELKEVGGAEGVLYHKLTLVRAPGVELPKVVSEGEQRCLSIAAFFAELSTADDPHGIVFDDPVSSLDYRWREGVARRLVHESKSRQVVVFTHDIVFLLQLRQFAEEEGIEQLDQHVRQLSKGAGVCADELPWVALPVKKKIGYLKKERQGAEKLFREGHQAAYEKDATYLYGLLREAWERALEEVLLGGVVERYRPGVQTQHIATIADITLKDCQILDAAMTKCSRLLPGHDKAAAARAPVPEPAELKDDIESLEKWVAEIRARR
jgi:energy-coupling factor transporter ATP-binding protein EcfA2